MSSNDEFLEFLVKKVEETGIGISITLSLKGLAVAGTMMRSQLYYEGVSRLSDDLNKPENFSTNNESDRELWRRYHESLKQYIEYMKEESENENKREVNPRFIHLKHVMIYPLSESSSSDISLPVIGEFWRGKLSSVDGFFLGMPAVPSHEEHAEDNDEQKS